MGCMSLNIPEYGITLFPGNVVRLERFSSESWKVEYGWYSFGGNRPVCGWYLINIDCATQIKPIQYTDIPEIYLIERH